MTTTTSSTTAATTTPTTQSLGASILTSLNAGSGIDTDTLVTNLVAAQKSTLEDSITTAQTANTAQISAAGGIASDISSFSSSLTTLIAGGTLMSTPTSSDTTVATATAIAGARLGNLNSTIKVTSLATAQTISGDMTGFTGASSATTLTITTAGTTTTGTDSNGNPTSTTTGSVSTPITIPANASIKDVATAINAAKTGVTASVVTSGGKTTLVLKGTTGAANAFSITDNDSSLDAITYGANASSGSTMTSTSTAADAVVNVDGVDVKSASNTLTGVVAGVTVTITKPGTVTLTGTRPTDSITEAVNDFVSAYNQLKAELDTATAAATSSTSAGALAGNSTIRDMRRQLGQLTTTRLTGGGTISTLAQLGVSTNQDGTLSVDATTLSNILTQYPDDVEAMFNPAQTSSSSAVSITSKVGAVAAGVYSLTGLAAANGSAAATGTVNGVAMTGAANTLTAATGSPANGLSLTLSSTATVPGSATLTIDLGLGGALAMISAALTGTAGSLTTLQSRLTTQSKTLSDQLTAADAKLTVYHDRLVSQFSTMNTRVSAFKATASYLTQQVDLWTKSTS
jgi:flagellar hook-associated protein 2